MILSSLYKAVKLHSFSLLLFSLFLTFPSHTHRFTSSPPLIIEYSRKTRLRYLFSPQEDRLCAAEAFYRAPGPSELLSWLTNVTRVSTSETYPQGYLRIHVPHPLTLFPRGTYFCIPHAVGKVPIK